VTRRLLQRFLPSPTGRRAGDEGRPGNDPRCPISPAPLTAFGLLESDIESLSSGPNAPSPEGRGKTKRFVRQPLLHFLLLGALLFLAKGWLPPPAPPIHDSAADVERLRQDWRNDTGLAPTPAQLQASLERWLDDEVLLREALRLGLDRRDAVAQRRLLMNLRDAYPDSPLDDAALLREAEALEMQQSDLVVRRRLVQAMEQRLLVGQAFSERELQDYIAAHPQRYAAAPRYSFRQVFVSGAGKAARAEAARLLAQLQREPQAPTLPGEPFLLGERFDALSAAEIARSFGEDFAVAVQRAPAGQWSGPQASPYGLHLLQVQPLPPPAAPDPAERRRQAAYALLAEREPQQLARLRAQLRQRYPVVIESGIVETGALPEPQS